MFDIAPTELLVVAIVALVVIGPKDLPKVMRTVGHWVGRARGMARHFRSGIDTMIRESELEEMEKKWREDNDRIMREHPMVASDWPAQAPDWDSPAPGEALPPPADPAQSPPVPDAASSDSAPPAPDRRELP